MKYEHWFAGSLNPPCWLIANAETGDLLTRTVNGRKVCVEFATESELLAKYPTSTRSTEMGD